MEKFNIEFIKSPKYSLRQFCKIFGKIQVHTGNINGGTEVATLVKTLFLASWYGSHFEPQHVSMYLPTPEWTFLSFPAKMISPQHIPSHEFYPSLTAATYSAASESFHRYIDDNRNQNGIGLGLGLGLLCRLL